MQLSITDRDIRQSLDLGMLFEGSCGSAELEPPSSLTCGHVGRTTEMLMKRIAIFLSVAALALASSAFAHSGGTDSQGCHVDHTTGQRHCH